MNKMIKYLQLLISKTSKK